MPDAYKTGPAIPITEDMVDPTTGMVRAVDVCDEFVDDGKTRKCRRCGWWRSTHGPDG